MDLSNFLWPEEEEIEEVDSEEVLQQVIEVYSKAPEVEEEEEGEEQPREVPISEAINALRTLRIYEESIEHSDKQGLESLNRMERVLLRRQLEAKDAQQQKTLHSFFKQVDSTSNQ